MKIIKKILLAIARVIALSYYHIKAKEDESQEAFLDYFSYCLLAKLCPDRASGLKKQYHAYARSSIEILRGAFDGQWVVVRQRGRSLYKAKHYYWHSGSNEHVLNFDADVDHALSFPVMVRYQSIDGKIWCDEALSHFRRFTVGRTFLTEDEAVAYIADIAEHQ